MKIYKYTIELSGCTLDIPCGAEFLSCQLQNNQIVAWYVVNPNKSAITPVKFTVLGTNHPVPEHLTKNNYLSTLQLGPLVLHVFSELLG